jgi:hypothetical protein
MRNTLVHFYALLTEICYWYTVGGNSLFSWSKNCNAELLPVSPLNTYPAKVENMVSS